MFRRPFVILILFVALYPVAADDQSSDALQLRLATRLGAYSVSESSFVQALAKIASEFHLPMGIERFDEGNAPQSISISASDITLRELLDLVVASQPGYKWAVKGGVVHVFPERTFRDKRSFLNLSLPSFEVQDDYVMFASRRLQNQLRLTVSPPLQLPGAGSAGSMATGLGDRRVSFSLQNATVRDVLDQLCLSADFKIWIVTYAAEDELTPGGFLRTLSIWNRNVPDQHQPVWDFLRWGFDPVRRVNRPDWTMD